MTLEGHLSGVLELFEFDASAADHVEGLHETLHALPHVVYRILQLMSHLCSQGDFVLAQGLAHLGAARRVLLQAQLVQGTLVRIGLTKHGEELSDNCRLGSHLKLI